MSTIQFTKGMIIKMSGLSVKKENGVFEINNTWEESCSVYKIKKDGSRIKSKYALDIFDYDKMEKYGQIITLEEVPAAITEINKQLKVRKDGEIVISYVSTIEKEMTNKCYVRVLKPIYTTSSIYAISSNNVFQLTINEKWNNVTWERIGKRGEIVTSYDKSLMSWKISSMEKLFNEGYLEIVERVETVRKEMDQTEEVTTEETNEIIENVIEEVQETIEVSNEVVTIKTEQDNAVIEAQNETVNATYQLNDEKQGVEIYFNDKPSEEVRNQMKALGYRWGKFKKCWYAKQSEETIALAKQLTGEQATNETVQENTFTYPEIEIDDNDNYTIPQNIQDAEHDGHWLFRSEKKDHNKQIQEYFTQLTNEVKQIIQTTENEYIIYKLKKTLQYYKKHYHQNYLARLTNKANNPSWVVTGRAGRNSSRDTKYNNRYDKLMQEYIDLENDYKSRISTLENKIYNDKKQQLRNKIENTNVTIEFKTETKEFYYMGQMDKRRVYSYDNYFISKLYGCFRLFHNGKEINIHLKTTDTLETAKKALSMYIQQQETKKGA
jgi:hypothetical protein